MPSSPKTVTRYLRIGHRFVEGWVEPGALRLVAGLAEAQRRLGVRGGVAEIGVHHGRFFLALHLTRGPGEASIAVDLFDEQEHNVDKSGRGDLSAFRANLHRHAADPQATIIAADSSTLDGEALIEHADGRIRMFSVDGGHFAELVEHDMATARDSLAPGGIIIGDDVFNFQWPGAAEGTLAFLSRCDDVVPFAIGFNKVFFTHRDYANRYREAVEAAAPRQLWACKSSVMHGEKVAVVWTAPPRLLVRLLTKRLLGLT